ncbi:MAG: NADH-quinone oxidoreductase subunit C, partial [Bacteroidota bacterium]
MKEQEEIFDYLKEQFGEDTVEFMKGDVGRPWFQFPAVRIKEIAKFLRDTAELRFNTLMCLSGVHYAKDEELGVTYHVNSTTLGHSMAFKVRVPIDQPNVPSVESIWKTAD